MESEGFSLNIEREEQAYNSTPCLLYVWKPDFDSNNVDNTTNNCGDSTDIPCFGTVILKDTKEPMDFDSYEKNPAMICQKGPADACVKVNLLLAANGHNYF